MNRQDLNKCFSIDGDNTLRVDYDLNHDSVVFDLGGYQGSWTQKIYEKYQSNIYVFEPIPSLYNDMCKKFEHHKKIKLFNYGLSDTKKNVKISLLQDGSSFYIDSNNTISVGVESIVDFIKKEELKKVDLIKINIEGDEYPILFSLIENNLIGLFDNIQVQFHQFIDNSIVMRNEIRQRLSATHYLTYDYEFVWENWKKF